MAWTSPKTYTVGELLTAADMNLYQRDNLSAALPYGTTWQTYTPQLTASTTDPTLGTGSTQRGRYYRVGQLVVVHFHIQFGSSGTAAGSGNYFVSVPVSISTSLTGQVLGHGKADDDGTNDYVVVARRVSASTVAFDRDGSNTAVGSAAPFAWGANDVLSGTLAYEAV